MHIELKLNGTTVFASDAPSTPEWFWQQQHQAAIAFLTSLSDNGEIPLGIRMAIASWLNMNQPPTLYKGPPVVPATGNPITQEQIDTSS